MEISYVDDYARATEGLETSPEILKAIEQIARDSFLITENRDENSIDRYDSPNFLDMHSQAHRLWRSPQNEERDRIMALATDAVYEDREIENGETIELHWGGRRFQN